MAETGRIGRIMDRFGERFVRKIARAGEIRRPPGHAEFAAEVASLFAAKEAVYKALGLESIPIRFPEVEILKRVGGAPEVKLHGRLAGMADRLSITKIHVSITHGRGMVAAVAVAVRRDP